METDSTASRLCVFALKVSCIVPGKGGKYPVTERISRRGFYLPSGLGLTETQLRRSADAVKKVLAG